jgi:hypothetical protein
LISVPCAWALALWLRWHHIRAPTRHGTAEGSIPTRTEVLHGSRLPCRGGARRRSRRCGHGGVHGVVKVMCTRVHSAAGAPLATVASAASPPWGLSSQRAMVSAPCLSSPSLYPPHPGICTQAGQPLEQPHPLKAVACTDACHRGSGGRAVGHDRAFMAARARDVQAQTLHRQPLWQTLRRQPLWQPLWQTLCSHAP